MDVENTEYLIFKETLGSGIRNQSLLNFLWVELKLYEQFANERKSTDSKELYMKYYNETIKIHPSKIRFSTYLRDKNRLNDIQSLLNCSERTARDYWKTLIHSELMNKPKLEYHQRNVLAHLQDKE
jgi:hypothetical protein